ncbi:chemotaxis protein CheC, partial [Candidatus Hakubella thermalkaliphila]
MPELPISEEFKLDVLKEMGNIGAGNAATALSTLLNYERVNMHVPEVSFCPLVDIPDLMGGAEKSVFGIYIRVFSEVSFYAVFLIDFESAQTLVASLTGHDYPVMEEMGRSVLLEVGNIVTASYLNALSHLTNLTFLPDPPLLAVDMAGAILGTVLAETNVAEDHILVLKTTFV